MYSLHHLWMKTYLQMNRKVMEQTAPLGLSPGQPKILECLALHGECEQKTIAEYCEIEPATAGNILTRMEAAGLVIRRNRPGNRRSLYVSLTDRGAELARTLCGIFLSAAMRSWRSVSFHGNAFPIKTNVPAFADTFYYSDFSQNRQ